MPMSRVDLNVGVVLLFIVLPVTGCMTAPEPPPVEELLPSPGFGKQWKLEGPVRFYGPDTLFDYINGEAELYYPYGFEEAATATYARPQKPDETVTADVFAMGSLLDAFGLYSNYRDTSADPVSMGADGFCDGYQLMFYKGRYFVRIMGMADKETNAAAMTECAEAIAAGLPVPGGDRKPAQLALVNVDGLVPGSSRYVAESVLGYRFLPRGLLAKVEQGDATVRVFVVLPTPDKPAHRLLNEYIGYLSEENVAIQKTGLNGSEALLFADPLYKGSAVLTCGDYMLGVIGLVEPADGVPLLRQLIGRVDAYEAG